MGAPAPAREPSGAAPAAAGGAVHAVVCRGVTKVYRTEGTETHALRGVDLEARAGEMLLLVGPSGCGKTTLLSVVAGILDRTEGDVRVFGEDVHAMTEARRTEFRLRNIGFVFQQFNLLPPLTSAENVAVPLILRGVRRAAAVAKARDLLARVGLADLTEVAPPHLSGGQQQRVAIARALAAEPRLIVCDEPTSSLDETGAHVMDVLRRTAVTPDRCVLVVTHDSRVFPFGDRIARMLDGRVVSVTDGAEHAA